MSLSPSDLDLVATLLYRDIHRADCGYGVDTDGIISDLSTLDRGDLLTVVDAVEVVYFRSSESKVRLLERVRNRLTAVSRARSRAEV